MAFAEDLKAAERTLLRTPHLRMALGAQREDIGSFVAGRALAPVGLGLVIGFGVAAMGARLTRSLLYGVEPR